MNLSTRPLLFITLIGTLLTHAASAQETIEKSAIQNNLQLPIEAKSNLGFLGLIGGGMEYRLNGQIVSHYEDFKSLIYPLHDPEASQLIQTAQTTDFVGWMVGTSGLAVGLDVALVYKPNVIFNVNWLDRIITGLLTAQIGTGLGAVFHNAAEGEKFNAVQRYNQLMKIQSSQNIELSPQIYAEQGQMGLGMKCLF